MKKYMSLLLSVVVALSVLLVACTPSGPAGETVVEKRDTVIIAQYGDPPILEPHNSLNDNAMRVNTNIYDPLIRMDENFQPVPSIAERWEVSPDGKEYIFYIREGVKFHNGDELTVSDVAFSINRGISRPQASPSYTGVLEAVVIDGNAVKVTLSSVNHQLLSAFALPFAGIVSEKVVTESEKDGGTYGREPIGTGPFMFSKWVTGERIELTAFDDYFLGKPGIDNVVFVAIADQSAAIASLEKGDIHAYVDVDSPHFNRIEQVSSLKLHIAPSFHLTQLFFNCSKAPFDNVKVRQAIAHAMDKEALVYGVADGDGEVIHTIGSKDMLGYTDDVTKYEFDLDKARALLAEAGYADGFECDIAMYVDREEKYALVLANSLEEIGIKITIQRMERAAYDEYIYSGQHDIVFAGLTYAGPDLSDNQIRNAYHSANIETRRSRIFYRNDRLDTLIDQGRNTLDDAIRAELHKEMLILLSEEVPTIPFIWTRKNIAAHKDLKNVYAQPQSMYYLWGWEWAD